MPLFREIIIKNGQCFIWKHEEGETFSEVELTLEENEKVAGFMAKRRAEFMMVRKLLQMQRPSAQIIYDEDGQPSLMGAEFFISITHSYPFAAIALSSTRVGIDLEKVRAKILRVKDKFIWSQERNFIPESQELKYLTAIWSIKESLYKLHHSNYWSLKRNYEVRPFALDDTGISCRVYDDSFSDDFTSRLFFFEDFCFSVVH